MGSDGAPPGAADELAEQSAGTGAPEATPPPAADAPAERPAADAGATPQPASPPEGGPADATPPGTAPSEQAARISWASLSPEDRHRLLSEADREELRQHENISGLAGDLADKRFRSKVQELRPEDLPPATRDRLTRQLREELEAQQREAQEAQLGQNGEYYTLGQQRWEDIQRRKEQQQSSAAREAVEREVYADLQRQAEDYAKTLPPEVVDRTAQELDGKLDGLPVKAQYHTWVATLNRVNAEHTAALRARAEAEEWEKKKLPAFQQRWLAERNGSEPSPETDGGAPASSRELTDELIDAMSLEEFKAVWDMATDTPKAGYRYRSTRGVDPRAVKAAGRAF